MSAKPIVLVVQSTPSEGEMLACALDSPKYHTVFVETPEDALVHVESPVDLVISRVGPRDPVGRELLDRWKSRRPQTPFLLMTDAEEVKSAREAVEVGATGYVPFGANGENMAAEILKWLEQGPQAPAPQTNGRQGLENTHTSEMQVASTIRIPPGTTLEDLERAAVEQALVQHHGNRTHAAKELGISVRTLQRKLKAWGEGRANQNQASPELRDPSRTDGAGRAWSGSNPSAPRQQPNYRPRLATV